MSIDIKKLKDHLELLSDACEQLPRHERREYNTGAVISLITVAINCFEALQDDVKRGLRIGHELTLETQTVEEMAADLVRQVRSAREERDKLSVKQSETINALKLCVDRLKQLDDAGPEWVEGASVIAEINK